MPAPGIIVDNVSGTQSHHHHKHQGLDPLIRSVSRVTTALANVSSVFQLFSFLVVCSGVISKVFGFVAFFASVETSRNSESNPKLIFPLLFSLTRIIARLSCISSDLFIFVEPVRKMV